MSNEENNPEKEATSKAPELVEDTRTQEEIEFEEVQGLFKAAKEAKTAEDRDKLWSKLISLGEVSTKARVEAGSQKDSSTEENNEKDKNDKSPEKEIIVVSNENNSGSSEKVLHSSFSSENNSPMKEGRRELPYLKAGFGKIKYEEGKDEELSMSINTLVTAARKRVGFFNSQSIMFKIEECLPFEVKNKLGNYNNLEECLGCLTKVYNFSGDLSSLRLKLNEKVFVKKELIANQATELFLKLEKYNQRCLLANKPQEQWNELDMWRTILKKIKVVNRRLAVDLMQYWNVHGSNCIKNVGDLRAIVSHFLIVFNLTIYFL